MSALHAQTLQQKRHLIISTLLNEPSLISALLKGLSDNPRLAADAHLSAKCQLLDAACRDLHAADMADILESLPEDARQALWQLVPVERRGQILVEAADNIRESLTGGMSDKALLRAIEPLDLDDQAWLARFLSRDLTGRLLTTLKPRQRADLLNIIRNDVDGVARVMDFNFITVRGDIRLGVVQRFLRRKGKIPAGTDKLFVTDDKNILLGELMLTDILLHSPQHRVSEVMNKDPVTFRLEDKGEDAASAFERYNLISAAVTGAGQQLIGRIAIEDIIDLVNQKNENNIRNMGGVSQEEDVFAPVTKAVRNRCAWLALNLCTAFVASRVIGLFENTIAHLVALATLMPIVAGIGGNTGNQTITMIVRALALRQVEPGNFSFLFLRELGVALINGILWGGIMGGITWLMYHDLAMGGVMMLAMVLNLLLAAFMGVMIPLIMTKLKRDPAVGSSVLITAMTDTGGFFIFLGLATLFLLH